MLINLLKMLNQDSIEELFSYIQRYEYTSKKRWMRGAGWRSLAWKQMYCSKSEVLLIILIIGAFNLITQKLINSYDFY